MGVSEVCGAFLSSRSYLEPLQSNIGGMGVSEVCGSMMSPVNSSIRIRISISSIGEMWSRSIGDSWGRSIVESWSSIVVVVVISRVSLRFSLSLALVYNMFNRSTLGNILGTKCSSQGRVDLGIEASYHRGWCCHKRLDISVENLGGGVGPGVVHVGPGVVHVGLGIVHVALGIVHVGLGVVVESGWVAVAGVGVGGIAA